MFNGEAKEFVLLDRQKRDQEVQTNDEIESSPSISKRKNYRRMRRLWQQRNKRKKVQQNEEKQTGTGTLPTGGCAPQTAATKDEQEHNDDMPDAETLDFINELYNLASIGMSFMVKRNCK